jgi:glycyl-tRNA synthetase beta chain
MSMKSSLLFEIGVEELPASYVEVALSVMPELLRTRLAEARIDFGAVRVFGTPRRLAVHVMEVAAAQRDLDEEVVGPPEAAAYKDGAPTRAAVAFAEKLGVGVQALSVVQKEAAGKQKAGRFVVARRVEQGKPSQTVLPALLADFAAAIPFRKSMRWAECETPFGRPVQWLVSLLGKAVLPVTFAGVNAGRSTRGHRFLASEAFEVADADAYVEALAQRHVYVDTETRKTMMLDRVRAEAARLGGRADAAELLVSENLTLVEEPFVVSGSYDKKFLELPASVIRAVARGHQRYFCVEKSEDELLPSYVAVVNTAEHPDNIRKGMDRVMTARLSDARFFFEEDKKVPISARVEKLRGIVFHHRLGTVLDKTERLRALSGEIAQLLSSEASPSAAAAQHAAGLLKFDLASLMVSEFPELQGHMGRAYALHAGEPAEVANAIREHYDPIGVDAPLPASKLGAVLALADRLDTLVGCFAVGMEPSGSADPFALRRNCISILRLLLATETGAPNGLEGLRLSQLLSAAYSAHAAQSTASGEKKRALDLDKNTMLEKVSAFFEERLRGLLTQATEADVADFVLSSARQGGASHAEHPGQALAKAKAVFALRGETWLASAKTVSKRLSGIGKDAQPKLHDALNPAKEDDARVVTMVKELDACTGNLGTVKLVTEALQVTGRIAQELDAIFVRSLMSDPADPHTPARLETLAYGAACMLRLGDFGKLQK